MTVSVRARPGPSAPSPAEEVVTGRASDRRPPGSAPAAIIGHASVPNSLLAATLARKDLHAGAAVPDAEAQEDIDVALDPAVTRAPPPKGGGAPPPPAVTHIWGGHIPGGMGPPTPSQAAARAATLNDFKTDIEAEVQSRLADLKKDQSRRAAHGVSTQSLEGPGEAAKEVTDREIGPYIANSAGAPARPSHTFKGYAKGTAPAARGSANLLDAYDPDDRRATGTPIDAEAVVQWAALNSPGAKVRKKHHFRAPDGSQEEDWLINTAVPQIAAARRADYELWDQFGFALAPGSGRILMPSIPDAGLSTKAVGGKLSPAERAFRWTSFETLIHEYIHTVEHPAHERARRASPFDSALNEGVTDLLTEEVYNAVAGSVRNDQALIDKVERGGPAPKPVPVSVLAKSYAIAYPDEVADVRAALSGVSMDGLKASYLMGHVEYVGLEASGADRTPVATGTGQGLDLPAAVTSMAQLVTQSGVAEAAIKAANPQVKSWAPLPRRLNVPGWREHIVVADPTSGTVETLTQIAAQHDVTEADLKRHNGHQPGWPTLGAGTKLLIPPKGLPKSPGGGP